MTDSYFWSCWVVSIRYYSHYMGISFRGYLRVGSIWWDQHRFDNSASSEYSSSEVPLRGQI
jgi:hypothetical protein